MTFALPGPSSRIRRAPLLTTALAIIVTAAVLLAPIYLILRAAEQGGAIWNSLTESDAVLAFLRTIILTVSVTTTCIALAVPLAWLTVRTNLPWPRIWTV